MSWRIVALAGAGLATGIHLGGILWSSRAACRRFWNSEDKAALFCGVSGIRSTRIDREVAKRLGHRMLEPAKSSQTIMALFFQWVLFPMLYTTATGKERWMVPLSDVSLLMGTVGLSLPHFFPGMLSLKTLNLWHLFVMGLLCIAISPACVNGENSDFFWGNEPFHLIMRLFACDLSSSNALVAASNAVFSVLAVFSFRQAPPDGAGRFKTYLVYLFELSSFVFINFQNYRSKKGMEASVRHEVEAAEARGACAAVESLLKTMSDAVVSLDDDLKIEEDCPKLAGMLLKYGSLVGVRFESLLATPEDRTRYLEHLSKGVHTAASIANAFHVALVDGMQNVVKAEIFHVCFAPFGDRVQHTLGVREFRDNEQPPGMDEFTLAHQDTAPLGVEGVSMQESEAPGDLPAGVLLETHDMKISGCSEAFVHLVGENSSTDVIDLPLKTWLSKRKNKRLFSGYDAMLTELRVAERSVISKVFKAVLDIRAQSEVHECSEVKCRAKVTVRRVQDSGCGVEPASNADASIIFTLWSPQGSKRKTRSSETSSKSSSSRGSASSRSRSSRSATAGTVSQMLRYDLGTHELVSDLREPVRLSM